MEENTPEYEHEHCDNCVRLKCRLRTGCPFKQCVLNCGAKFHACKEEEHALLCKLAVVDCINEVNGCPLKMQRSHLAAHLEICPASVVVCNSEWNRWPAYSKELDNRVPFNQGSINGKCVQLDVALALRDQRMLSESMAASKKLRRSLRNRLTERYPAVPLIPPKSIVADAEQVLSDSTDSGDESDCPWAVSKVPPGLLKSMCHELFGREQEKKLKKKDESSNSTNTSDKENENVIPARNDPEMNTTTKDANCDTQVSSNVSHSVTHSNGVTDTASTNLSAASGDGRRERQERSQTPVEIMAAQKLQAYASANDVNMHALEIDTSYDDTATSDVYGAPPPSLALKTILGVDIQVEYITNYQPKPRSLYTFLCLQPFRRDQYAGHKKNVHSDILSNVNGWVEHRCPLACYGCTYSQRRLEPKNGTVVYNYMLNSFGVRPHTHYSNVPKFDPKKPERKPKESTPEFYTSVNSDSILQVRGNIAKDHKNPRFVRDSVSPFSFTLEALPSEILRHVFSYLDGFSLANLAVTSKRIRGICNTLLPERGMVLLEWTKLQGENGERPQYYILEKRWIFGTSFTAVHTWEQKEQEEPMSEHLRTCPFQRPPEPRTTPFRDLRLRPLPETLSKLQKMYPGFTGGEGGEEGEEAENPGAVIADTLGVDSASDSPDSPSVSPDSPSDSLDSQTDSPDSPSDSPDLSDPDYEYPVPINVLEKGKKLMKILSRR